MAKKKKSLTRKQLAVIEDMFKGVDEAQIMENHGLSRSRYRLWMNDGRFVDELHWRMQSAKLQSELIISRYAQVAAMKLVQLTDSDKEETARKACLDIISLPVPEPARPEEKEDTQFAEGLTAKMASRLLEVLAGAKGQ